MFVLQPCVSMTTIDILGMIMGWIVYTGGKNGRKNKMEPQPRDRVQLRLNKQEIEQLTLLMSKQGLEWPDLQRRIVAAGIATLLEESIPGPSTSQLELTARVSALEQKVVDLENCPFVGHVLEVARRSVFIFLPIGMQLDRGYKSPHLRKLYWLDQDRTTAAYVRVTGNFDAKTGPGRLKQLTLTTKNGFLYADHEIDFVDPASIGLKDLRLNSWTEWPGPPEISNCQEENAL